MKRQRSVLGSETTTTLPTTKETEKKAKTRVGQEKEEVAAAKVIIEDQIIRDGKEFAEIVKTVEIVGWDELPCLWLAVDEQMSWGTCWSPSWDMEFIDGEAYHALYSDVVWEDDIWDLKDIKNVPSTLPSP